MRVFLHFDNAVDLILMFHADVQTFNDHVVMALWNRTRTLPHMHSNAYTEAC